MRKKRILLTNEASFLSTGYSTYGLEVLRRLHATGKYELAELASYGHYSDPRALTLPWRFYGNLPSQNDERQRQEYESQPCHNFGAWRFEETLLDFRPDIVFSVRDWWMDEHIERSPYRPFFHWAYMPTVDSYPQDSQWISTFMDADAVFTYSDWGLKILDDQSGGKIHTVRSHPPGADLNVFRPIHDKAAHKKSFGFSPDMKIVGTVMRNQKRKLFPDLLEAFASFLKLNPTLAHKTFLYFHTSYPDVGWHLPQLLAEHGLGHKVLFTYVCRQCGCVFPSFYQDAKTACVSCGQVEAGLPNTQNGISNEQLAGLMNLFDVYVQYALAEGFGMPQVEAAACGIPIMAVDYSAMSDIVRKLRGTPIAVQRMFRESETHCYRALPDNADFIRKLEKLLTLPEAVLRANGAKARKGVETHYTWDRTAKLWEEHFDSVEVRRDSDTWKSPPRFHQPAMQIPGNLSHDQLVTWAMTYVLGDPSKVNSYMASRMVRDLHYGVENAPFGDVHISDASFLGSRMRLRTYDRDEAMRELYSICAKRNYWEKRRVEYDRSPKPDFVVFAKPQEASPDE